MAQLFHAVIAENTYLISDDSFGTDLAFGKPTANSYLIVGESRALLFDLAVPAPVFASMRNRLPKSRF